MSGQRSGRRRGRKPKTIDIWRPVADLPDAPPIRIAEDPTALVRSLGDPPLMGQSTVATHYLTAVIERASGVAVALAASANLLSADGEPEAESH